MNVSRCHSQKEVGKKKRIVQETRILKIKRKGRGQKKSRAICLLVSYLRKGKDNDRPEDLFWDISVQIWGEKKRADIMTWPRYE